MWSIMTLFIHSGRRSSVRTMMLYTCPSMQGMRALVIDKDNAPKKMNELEQHLLRINSGDKNRVKAGIEDFSVNVQLDVDSVLNKQSIIDECFSKNSVEEIIKSLETESGKEGNARINSVLAGLKKSSPLALKITLKSVLSIFYFKDETGRKYLALVVAYLTISFVLKQHYIDS